MQDDDSDASEEASSLSPEISSPASLSGGSYSRRAVPAGAGRALRLPPPSSSRAESSRRPAKPLASAFLSRPMGGVSTAPRLGINARELSITAASKRRAGSLRTEPHVSPAGSVRSKMPYLFGGGRNPKVAPASACGEEDYDGY